MENTSNDYNRMIMNLNSECVDCGTLNPTYASVNNGVTLCSDCKANHEKLFNYSTSFIINLNEVPIDSTIYQYFEYGGNLNFNNNLKSFEINTKQVNITKKYKCLATELYRKGLNCKVHNKELQIGNMSVETNNDNKMESHMNIDFPNEYPELMEMINPHKKGIIEKTKTYIINTAIPVKDRLVEGKDFALIRLKRFFGSLFTKKNKKDIKVKAGGKDVSNEKEIGVDIKSNGLEDEVSHQQFKIKMKV